MESSRQENNQKDCNSKNILKEQVIMNRYNSLALQMSQSMEVFLGRAKCCSQARISVNTPAKALVLSFDKTPRKYGSISFPANVIDFQCIFILKGRKEKLEYALRKCTRKINKLTIMSINKRDFSSKLDVHTFFKILPYVQKEIKLDRYRINYQNLSKIMLANSSDYALHLSRCTIIASKKPPKYTTKTGLSSLTLSTCTTKTQHSLLPSSPEVDFLLTLISKTPLNRSLLAFSISRFSKKKVDFLLKKYDLSHIQGYSIL
ncbi:unnamed protein product [Moneuplotes crassus]|uniref:Uncharacterized protein n=1 Tax=Euplotes crassus TaxID=5936 RepID=A0AAD1XRT0_EUPCR|nr:unnamed protein product [Moneuplotes crassus]